MLLLGKGGNRMKVLILGGAGTMGGGAGIILAGFEDVSKITLADISLEGAQAYADQIGSPKVDVVQIDVTDREALIALVKGYDSVLSAVGPYTRFGVMVLDAIIEAGVPYVDVCDDHDATEELLKLNDKAVKAGVPAIICMGTTPGTTNMQAKLAHEHLDDVDVLKVCWAVGLPELEKVKGTPLEFAAKSSGRELLSPAAWEHMLHVSTGDIPIWKGGKWDTMPALEHGEYVDFALPLGRVESYFLGHAEPITLPRYLKINDFSACLGALMPKVTQELRQTARGHQFASNPPVDPETPLWEAPKFWRDRGVWAGQAAIAEGLKDGVRKRVTVRLMMSHLDMVPYNYGAQAIGAYLLAKGAIDKPGVYAPEAVLDTKEYFDYFTDIFNGITNSSLSTDELILVDIENI